MIDLYSRWETEQGTRPCHGMLTPAATLGLAAQEQALWELPRQVPELIKVHVQGVMLYNNQLLIRLAQRQGRPS